VSGERSNGERPAEPPNKKTVRLTKRCVVHAALFGRQGGRGRKINVWGLSTVGICTDARTAKPLGEVVGVDHACEAPPNVFLLVAPLPPTIPAFNAALAVKVVHSEKRVAEASVR
jgi:hypothetical protein